jgi:hypothetical protein
MSVAFTEAAVRDRTKTVTRRKGWWEDKNGRRMVKPGDRLTLCRKVMGRKGAPLLRIAEVEVVHVQRHALSDLLTCDPQEAREEMALEGFPTVVPYEFVRRFFVEAQGMDVGDFVTRIEWRYLDAEAGEPT